MFSGGLSASRLSLEPVEGEQQDGKGEICLVWFTRVQMYNFIFVSCHIFATSPYLCTAIKEKLQTEIIERIV